MNAVRLGVIADKSAVHVPQSRETKPLSLGEIVTRAGESVLSFAAISVKIFASRLAQQTRSNDVVCRWGGDEFVAMSDCCLEAGQVRAAQIRVDLGGRYNLVLMGKESPVTLSVSVGVAEFQPGETAEQLFARADSALYDSKEKNRKRITSLLIQRPGAIRR